MVPTAISWIANSPTLSWDNPANWSTDTVPTINDTVTISNAVSGTITVSGSNDGVLSLNDVSASLSIATGASLSIAASAATSTLGQNVTIQSSGTLAVGAGAKMVFGSAPYEAGQTLADNGTLSFAAGDTVSLNDSNYYATEQIVVGSGGLLTASGTAFSATAANGSNGINSTQIVVSSGGHLQAGNSSFAVGQLNLNIGTVLNAGDLVGNGFDCPLYIPAIDV
ncbi:MAG TPA: hypothetical protein VG097_09480, partial [Gemmata sp.]|nr:hypothetical protein [Gemmata sp.]